mgnify:CR=1 FL=1
MELSKKAILDKTHYGLNIYAHILRSFYPDELVIHLSGKKCLPARNPFNNGKETLILENRDWVFCFQDVENPILPAIHSILQLCITTSLDLIYSKSWMKI